MPQNKIHTSAYKNNTLCVPQEKILYKIQKNISTLDNIYSKSEIDFYKTLYHIIFEEIPQFQTSTTHIQKKDLLQFSNSINILTQKAMKILKKGYTTQTQF